MTGENDKTVKTGMDLVVGDEVMLISGYGRVWTRKGTVTKVARVWLEVTSEGRIPLIERYRRDDQTDGLNYGSPSYFRTLDQYAQDQAKGAAWKWLSEQRIRIEFGSTWDPITVADVLRRHLENAGNSPAGED